MKVEERRFRAAPSGGEVSALLLRPPGASVLYVFGHGAGVSIDHPFMEGAARALAERGVATLRYRFPYSEAGRKAPDSARVLQQTVRSAVAEAARLAEGLPLLAGGKSMGGRMTSLAAAEEPLAGVRGIAFFGFPLHTVGRPSAERGEHLRRVGLPMLFLQGTRDDLADLSLLRPLLERVMPPPTVHVVDDADHGFRVPKRSGRTDAQVLEDLCDCFASWARGVMG